MIRRQTRTKRNETRFPYTTIFRSRSPSTGWSASRCGSGSEESSELMAPAIVAPLSPLMRSGGQQRDHGDHVEREVRGHRRSEEHTSELQSLMRISYAVFSLKQTK